MKILMVYCDGPQGNTVPIGITQVTGCLIKAGHEVELFHTTFYRQKYKSTTELRIEGLHLRPCEVVYNKGNMEDAFIGKVREFRPDIIGFSTTEPTFGILKRLLSSANNIIKVNSIKIAIGGIYAICCPELIANSVDLVDFISISEAENTFVELCEKINNGEDCRDQEGFWVKGDEKWHLNPPSVLTDIDRLPALPLHVFGDRYLMKPMMGKTRKTASVEVARGCPFSCTYCTNSYLNKKFGKWHRLKSISRLDTEIEGIVGEYRPAFIYKMAESFLSISKKRWEAYYNMYKKYKVPFCIETRPETLNNESCQMLKDLNCTRISIGLESGNEAYRAKCLNRSYSNNQVISAAKALHKYNISFSVNLIIGMPFETRSMIFEGLNLLRDIKPDGVSIYFFTPYKGCHLRKVCEDNDMVDKDYIGGDYWEPKYALRNNTIGNEVVGLWRTSPLYVHLPRHRFPLIEKAEKLTPDGDRAFAVLRKEFYDHMGWEIN